MLAAKILGNAIDRDDARWLSESPTIREKLERLNLISSGKIAVDRKSMTMEEFLDDYIERQGKSRKPATVAVWKQVVANLKEFMPAGIKINQITAGHAKEFHEKLKARGMATTTIHKRIQFARQFMHDAVDWKIIDENPFSKVRTQRSTVKVNEFVPREVVDKLMKQFLANRWGLGQPSCVVSIDGVTEDLSSQHTLNASLHTLRNIVATLGGHRLGNESDEHPRAEGRASRRPWHS